MGMLQGCAGSLAMILKDQDIFEPLVALQIEDSLPESPKHIFDALQGHRRQSLHVVGRFDDHLVSAHAVHAVEHALVHPIQIALNANRSKLVGYHAQVPARYVPPRTTTGPSA